LHRESAYFSAAPQALPHAAGFSSGAAAPQAAGFSSGAAAPQAAGFSAGFSADPQALPQAVEGSHAPFAHAARLERAMISSFDFRIFIRCFQNITDLLV
jgi:hypothetical protein